MGSLGTGKDNKRKDLAGRRRSGKALELSANAQKCGTRIQLSMCLERMEHFVSLPPSQTLPPKHI